MGKGRAPCCDKSQVKKGPWSPAEDLKLITFIQKQGHENWRALPKQAGLLRCGKSCRLRWINYLRPDVKRGNFTKEEEDTILRLHETMGNKWSKIASHFPGRTDNEIKNVWNTHLKKKLAFRDVNKDHESKESSLTSSSTSSSTTNMSSGKRRAETELDEHQWGHNHVLKKPRESGDKVAEESNQMISTSKEMIMKELSISSCSSDNSIVSNSSQVDATRPEDKMGSSFFDFTTHNEPYYQVGISINNCEEVNKPEIISDNELQIPLESDLDFWNMLDSLGTFQSNDQLVQLHEAEPSQSSSFGEANNINNKEADADSRKWLQYLENELGLETIEDQNSPKMEASASAEPEPLIPAETCEILLKSEVDPGISYFQLWSSSVF